MPYKRISGIYRILNTKNNKCYIGSGISIKQRFSTHIRLLNTSKHFNNHLQTAWNKYGEESFIFEILEESKENKLKDKEEYYIKLYKSNNRQYGYNKRIDCSTNLGIKASDETREKQRLSHLGVKHPEWRNKIKAISRFKKVHQYNLNGNYMNSYGSLIEAEEKTNIYRQSISACCRGINRLAGKFGWSFKKVERLRIRNKFKKYEKQRGL